MFMGKEPVLTFYNVIYGWRRVGMTAMVKRFLQWKRPHYFLADNFSFHAKERQFK
ncbi:hypothetical protein HUU39_01150 [candidate division KSB1 bacterium]|nr:hypothetical protein [bacterium]NUM63872.1 hypothetical protein [candidate division KSB1 bacterium]